jgi:hypothetical protein
MIFARSISTISVVGAPYGTITTVQSEVYPKEVANIKKIFFAQQALPQQVLPTASSAVTLQLPSDVEKEDVAKDGINKLNLFHICGTINHESISFGTLAYPNCHQSTSCKPSWCPL